MSILRRIFGVVLGFVVASAVMMLIEFTNGHLFYPELGRAAKQVTTPEQMTALMAQVPLGAMLVVLVAWVVGAIAGGWATTRFTRMRTVGPAAALGALLALAGVWTNLRIPPPTWFWVASLALMIPGSWYGARCAGA